MPNLNHTHKKSVALCRFHWMLLGLGLPYLPITTSKAHACSVSERRLTLGDVI